MSRSLLVIGTGGESRVGFLSSLTRYFERVVVLECPVTELSEYPAGIVVERCSALDRDSLAAYAAKNIGRFDRVTTIFEPCVLGAAFVRERMNRPGLDCSTARLFRSKTEMNGFLKSIGLPQPKMETYVEDGSRGSFVELCERIGAKGDLIVKPDSGYANLGVRKMMKCIDAVGLESALSEAKEDICNNQYAAADFEPEKDTWVISEFLDGKELEVDLYVVDGKIKFSGVHEKTVVRIAGQYIEENNAVTPPVTLTDKEATRLSEWCQVLCEELQKRVHGPAGNQTFNLYCEVIIVDGEVFCLEFADRIGGGYVPYSLKRSVGVDLFEVAAACCAQVPIEVDVQRCRRAVYWQLVYSPVKGFFRGIANNWRVDESQVLYMAEELFPIAVPHTDYVAAFVFEGVSAAAVSNEARQALQELRVKVSQTPDGPCNEYMIPVPCNVV